MSRQPVYKDGIRVSIRMDGDTKAKLEIASKKTGQTVTGIINEAMTEKLEKFKNDGMIINTVARTGEMERLTMLAEDGKNHDTKIVAFTNNKGGVAKTTSCSAVSHLMSKKYRVLVIDLDMQMNTSELFGYAFGNKETTVADYLATYFNDGTERNLPDYIHPTKYDNVDVMIAAHRMQTYFEQTVRTVGADRGDLIGRLFKEIKALNIYDFVFVDTSPSIGVLVTSTYKEADWLIIPTEADSMSIDGAFKVSSFIKRRELDELKSAKIAGVLFARAVTNTAMTKAIPVYKEQFEKHNIHCFTTSIPQTSDVPKSREESITVSDKYPSSKATKAYEAVCKELEGIING